MESFELPPGFVLPSQQRAREVDAQLLFTRRTIHIVYFAAILIGGALFLTHLTRRTALIAPIDANFHAFMIGLGVFVGILTAAVANDAWKIGIGVSERRPQPRGLYALFSLLALVAICGIGGDYVAALLVEWRAFHGIAPPAQDAMFTIVERHRSRTGAWIELEAASGLRFSAACGDAIYASVADGERVILPVETGRGGVQRVLLPARTSELRRV
ncbi:MAG: hypothetical protein JWO25_3926 [Alphaproteobacteria bacterium]|nr:hypothetical protein [Alphaproteobacteria bacterium]